MEFVKNVYTAKVRNSLQLKRKYLSFCVFVDHDFPQNHFATNPNHGTSLSNIINRVALGAV